MSGWPGSSEREKTSFGGLSRGQLMSRIRSTKNRTTEARLAELLRKARLNGWRRHRPLPGRPDFIWPSVKLAVFVDGCFWHGHDCGKNITPRTNAEAWAQKIRRNKARDKKVNRVLRGRGWSVMRIWECHLHNDPERCIKRVRRILESQVTDVVK